MFPVFWGISGSYKTMCKEFCIYIPFKESKMKRFVRVLFPLLTLCWLSFIFTNSAMDAEKSTEMSDTYTDKAVDIVEEVTQKPVTEEGRETLETIIRKSAHCLEFTLLSIVTYISFTVNGLDMKRHIFFLLWLGLLIGLTDEAIQLHSEGRYSSVVDVYIDFAGFALGACLCLFIRYLHRRKKTHPPVEQE
ncbi:MAG TPA: hypothetical protein DCY74_03755 [Clostridiales bacterium]|nr:hypothetical protein [Clostridiales bacterium]HBE13268.1 hypothetical protein [Clostridiales bacterium]